MVGCNTIDLVAAAAAAWQEEAVRRLQTGSLATGGAGRQAGGPRPRGVHQGVDQAAGQVAEERVEGAAPAAASSVVGQVVEQVEVLLALQLQLPQQPRLRGLGVMRAGMMEEVVVGRLWVG